MYTTWSQRIAPASPSNAKDRQPATVTARGLEVRLYSNGRSTAAIVYTPITPKPKERQP